MRRKKFLYGMIMSFALLWVMFSASDVHAVNAFLEFYMEVNPTLTSVVIYWSQEDGVEKYKIRQLKGKKYETIKTTGKDVNSYTVNNLKKNKRYTFQILGYTKKDGKYILLYKDTNSVTTEPETQWFPLEAKATSLTTVKLSWEKQSNGKKWVIRQKKGKKFKTIKTIKKNVKTCTIKHLKKNKEHQFELLGYVKKKGKYVLRYKTDCSVKTGIGTPGVGADFTGETAYPTDHSPSFIDVGFYIDDGYPSKGVEIWRRKKGSPKYKKIKTIKTKKQSYIYKDKNVEAGAYYYYKCRAFGTCKKKKIYSSFSKPWLGMARYDSGYYNITLYEVKDNSIILLIKSNKYNTNLSMDEDMYLDFSQKNKLVFSGIVTEWNVSGVWRKAQKSKKITIKPGQTVLMKLDCDYVPDDIVTGNYYMSDCDVEYQQEAKGNFYDNAYLDFTINGIGRTWMSEGYY